MPSLTATKRIVLAGTVVLAGVLSACRPITRNRQPTPVPTRTSGDESTVFFYDGFNNDTGIWDVFSEFGAVTRVRNGQLRISVDEPGQVAVSLAGFTLNNFDLTIEATQLAGPDENSYGVVFRYLNPNDFYRFDVAGDGRYGFSRFVAGDWEQIQPLTSSDAVLAGPETNVLRVRQLNGDVALFANDTLLLETTIAPGAGRIGVFASTFDEGGVQVSFDELTISTP